MQRNLKRILSFILIIPFLLLNIGCSDQRVVEEGTAIPSPTEAPQEASAEPDSPGVTPSVLEAACETEETPGVNESPGIEPSVTATREIVYTIVIPAGIPQFLTETIAALPGFEESSTSTADLRIIRSDNPDETDLFRRYYVVVAPFPTIVDGISLEDLKRAWRGEGVGAFGGNPLLVSEETRRAWAEMWGEPESSGVTVVLEEDLLDLAWKAGLGWALVPFEALEPRWKALRVDGVSVFELDQPAYPLVIHYGLEGDAKAANALIAGLAEAGYPMPLTNRNPEKMTTLLLTGVTALVRRTAEKMEEKGVTYPGEEVREWLLDADFAHISNEAPFYTLCPPAVPLRREARFCSDPAYFDLLRYTGVDIVELTGNHLMDWGAEALVETLDLYKREGLAYYGGGYNLEDALIPLEIEHNSNRIALLGCNAMGPLADWATETSPGSAPCDLDKLEAMVRRYAAEGFLPVVTFQHFEVCQVAPQSSQRVDFQRMAEAGAVIVSGSQAHCPQGMTFYGDSFVHYGLGNLFFDQMEPEYGRGQFLDRHIFYDGRYISTELLTAQLEDYAQPRPMTASERRKLLEIVFGESVWNQ